MKKEEKEEEMKSKLVLPQPPRLVKKARRRQRKFPGHEEGQPEIRNFLKAAGGCQPKIPQREIVVPTPHCRPKQKKDDDKLEPSTRQPAHKLRRKL